MVLLQRMRQLAFVPLTPFLLGIARPTNGRTPADLPEALSIAQVSAGSETPTNE
jgi:hypothetical protein